MGAGFAVDTETLSQLVADMVACEQHLEALTEEIERHVARLHEAWEGKAAQAQQLAQAEWQKGFLTMRAALAELRDMTSTAHDNYTAACEANVGMWQEAQ